MYRPDPRHAGIAAGGPAAEPVLRWRLRADTRRVLAELGRRVETGHPDPARAAPPASEEIPLCGP